MGRSFWGFLVVFLGLTQGSLLLHARTAEPLRPSELDDPANDDILSEDQTPAEQPAAVPPPPPPEEEPPPLRRKRAAEEDPYAPLGLSGGAFTLFPVLQIGGVWSSNPQQTSSGADPSIGLRVAPSLRLESDWVRHSFTLDAEGEGIIYADGEISPENSGNVTATGRIDIRRTTFAEIEASYDIDQTGASDSEVPDAATGDRIEHEYGGFASLSHEMGRLTLRGRSGARYRLFEDVELEGGGEEDNSDRNYLEPEVSLRATYETSPAVKPFAEVAYRPRLYSDTPDRNGFNRDSQGGQLKAGVQLDSSPIWLGEIAALYTFRAYEDDRLETISALGLSGNLTWRPTELTSITATANTSLDETIAAGSSGTRVYEARFDVQHLLRENITLVAGTGIEFDQRDGPNDTTYSGNAGVIYRFNPWLAWTASYNVNYFDSNAPDSDYVEHRVSTGIEVRR
jgi:hypothetical protein